MKLRKYITIAVMFSMLACSEPVKVEPFTYPEVISGDTKRAWSIRSIQFVQNGKGTRTFSLDKCITDDLYIFFNDKEKTLKIEGGATKCDDDEESLIVDSNWSIVNATSTLSMPMPLISNPPYPPLPFILKEIDDTKMVADIYFEDGSAYRFNFQIASLEE